MHEGETWYACVFQRFHDNHQQKFSFNILLYNYLLLELANYTMHGKLATPVYFKHFHGDYDQKWPWAPFSITVSSPFNCKL